MVTATKTAKKIKKGLISKKKQLYTCRTLFLYISLLLFCTTTTWNFQKLPSYTSYGGNVVCGPAHFFSLPLIFTLVTASISHFLTAAIKFSCYSSDEIGLLCFFFFNISGSSSFSVIHANVQHRSQGSLLPDPWSERERPWKTLVTCLPGEKKTQEGSLFLKVLSP